MISEIYETLPGFMRVLVYVSLQSIALIALIRIIQLVFREKLSPRWHYALWFLLLIRLATPWTPESDTSLGNMPKVFEPHEQSKALVVSGQQQPKIAPVMDFDVYPEQNIKTDDRAHRKMVQIIVIVFTLVWFFGMVFFAMTTLWRVWWIRRKIGAPRSITESRVLEILEDCRIIMGVRVYPAIIESEHVGTPVLFGYIRPKLVFPKGLTEQLTDEELKDILLHELAHLKRRDILVNWLFAAYLVVHWMNPFVWYAMRRIHTDREKAADELALSKMTTIDRQCFAETLVKMAEISSGYKKLPILSSFVGLVGTYQQIKGRLLAVTKQTPNKMRYILLVLPVVILVSCATLTSPSGKVVTEMNVLGYEGPAPSIPEVGDEPIPYEGKVLVNVVVVNNNRKAPVDHRELLLTVPDDLNRSFTLKMNKVKTTLKFNQAEYTNRNPENSSFLSLVQKPYLAISGSCQGRVHPGGSMYGHITNYGGISSTSRTTVNGYTLLAVATPVCDVEALREMALENWILANHQNWMEGCWDLRGWGRLKGERLNMIDCGASYQEGLAMIDVKNIGYFNISKDATVSVDPVFVDSDGKKGLFSYEMKSRTWTSATDEKILFGEYPGSLADAVSVVPTEEQQRGSCVFQLPDGRRGILDQTGSMASSSIFKGSRESYSYSVYLINGEVDEIPETVEDVSSPQQLQEVGALKRIGSFDVTKDSTVSIDPIFVDPDGIDGVFSYKMKSKTWSPANGEKILFGEYPGTLDEAVKVTPTKVKQSGDCVFQLPDGRIGVLQGRVTDVTSYPILLGAKKINKMNYTVYMVIP